MQLRVWASRRVPVLSGANRRCWCRPARALGSVLAGCALASAVEALPPRPPAPTLTLAAIRDLGVRVAGELEAEPSTPYRVLLLATQDCNGGDLGSDFFGLGELELRTDAGGQAHFSHAFETRLNDTQHVVARTMDATGDTSELSNCQPVSVELTYWNDVAARLTETAAAARPGEPFPFVVTIENRSETANGRPPVEGVAASFVVPEGARFLAASHGGVFDGAAVRFRNLTVPADGELRLSVTVLPLLVEVLEAAASVEDDGPYQGNNGAACEVEVDQTDVAQADLSLAMTAMPMPVRAGMELRYELAITNHGPDSAANVRVNAPLPTSSAFLRATTSQGTVAFEEGIVTCQLGVMTNGAVALVTVSVQPRAEGALTNAASVLVPSGIAEADSLSPAGWELARASGSRFVRDPNPDNNLASMVVEVGPAQLLEVVGSPAFNPQNGLFEQVVRFTNVGVEPLSGLRLWVRDVDAGVLVLNQSGTEDDDAYLQLGRAVEVAETFAFTVEFHHPDRLPVPQPEYEAVEHAGGNLEPPPPPGNPPIVLEGSMEAGGFTLSWNTVRGRRYLVQARPTVPDPWRTAGPAVGAATAVAHWTEPAETPTNPLPQANRFFRVLELP